MKKVFAVLALTLFLSGCTDAQYARATALGSASRVTCYSADMVIADMCSTGQVSSSTSSDGYYFNEATTKRLVEVSGNCIIAQDAPCPTYPVGLAKSGAAF